MSTSITFYLKLMVAKRNDTVLTLLSTSVMLNPLRKYILSMVNLG